MTNPLLTRLRNKEDTFVERKPEGAASAEFRRTLVAFANSVPEGRTAVLFIGVSDSGEITGIGNSDKLQKTVRDICERDCYPPIRYTSEVLNDGTKDVLAVEIGPSTKRPHFAGAAYIRRGSESVAASEEILNEMIASRNTKAGQLLSHKGETVTVDYEYHSWYPLGRAFDTQGPRGQPVMVRKEQFVIEGASAHSVELRNVSSGRAESISLERIVITKDVEHHRLIRLRVKVQE